MYNAKVLQRYFTYNRIFWYYYTVEKMSGRGLARIRRLTGGQEIAGSNPVAPTIFQKLPYGEVVERFFFVITRLYVRQNTAHIDAFRNLASGGKD